VALRVVALLPLIPVPGRSTIQNYRSRQSFVADACGRRAQKRRTKVVQRGYLTTLPSLIQSLYGVSGKAKIGFGEGANRFESRINQSHETSKRLRQSREAPLRLNHLR